MIISIVYGENSKKGPFYKDVETGWYYLQSRYYNPEIGRFINANGLIGETGDILGHNMYAYAKNNPVMMVDPSGELVFLAIIAIGGLVSAAVDFGFQLYENHGDISKTNLRELGGAFVGGAIASMPIPGLNLIGAMALGAVGNLASGLIGGSVDSLSSGAGGGAIGYGLGKLVSKASLGVIPKMLDMYPASSQRYPWNLSQYNNAVSNIFKGNNYSLTRSTMAGAVSSQTFTELGDKVIDKVKEIINSVRN